MCYPAPEYFNLALAACAPAAAIGFENDSRRRQSPQQSLPAGTADDLSVSAMAIPYIVS
jgi:hypothetical protein